MSVEGSQIYYGGLYSPNKVQLHEAIIFVAIVGIVLTLSTTEKVNNALGLYHCKWNRIVAYQLL